MNQDVPYLFTVGKLPDILDRMAKAHVPPAFTLDFLGDLGFKSSNYRRLPKLLRYLGLIDTSNVPLEAYRAFVNPTQSRQVLASCLRTAFDELFTARPTAYDMTTKELTGWFKSKTGKGESVATKIAATFKSLASYADFQTPATEDIKQSSDTQSDVEDDPARHHAPTGAFTPLQLTYRVELNLPDTTDLRTFRAIFKALREELLS